MEISPEILRALARLLLEQEQRGLQKQKLRGVERPFLGNQRPLPR